MNNHITNQIPIYREDGRVIGQVQGRIFKKRISGSKHLLHTPPAIALSIESLAQAEQAGAQNIEVTDKDNGRVYSCTLEYFKRYSWEMQRGGFEPQRALALERWTVTVTDSQHAPAVTTITAQPVFSEGTFTHAHREPVQLSLWGAK